MIFCDRLLFLHVPKAGGSSIVQALLEILPPPVHYSLPIDHEATVPPGVQRFEGVAHESLAEARVILERRGIRMEELPMVLACVRNPYALEVSRYSFLRQDLNRYNHGPQQAIALAGDFELFATCSRPHGGRPLDVYFSLDGATPANLRMVRLENVAEELPRCLEAVGVERGSAPIPHHNRSDHDDFARYYTPAAEEAVYQKYKWVFENRLYPRLDPDLCTGPCRTAQRTDVAAEFVDAGRLSAMDEFARANSWLAVAEIHRHDRCAAAQRDALERALDEARRTGSDRLVMRTAAALTRCLGLAGDVPVDEGIRRCERLLDDLPDGRASGSTRLALAELHAARGRFGRARALCDAVRGVTVEHSLEAASAAGSVSLLVGDAESAVGDLRRGRPWDESQFAGDRADALFRVGRHEDADRLAASTEATASVVDAIVQSRWRRVRAKAAAARGGAAPALALASEAVEVAAGAGSPNAHGDALVDLAEVRARVADVDGARAALHEAVSLYESKANAVSAAGAAARLAGAGAL